MRGRHPGPGVPFPPSPGLHLLKTPESFEELGPHDHVCHLYMDAEDRLSVLVPYFRIGLSRGEKCLLLCGEADAEEILNGLRGKGIDVGSALSRGALLVTQEPVARPGKGGDDPAALVAFFRSSARVAGSEKYGGLRVCVDVSFALGKGGPRERLVQYQRMLHDFLAEQKVLCLCLHGMNDFPAEFLLDALRAHPTVIYGGIVAKNFYFIPPTGDTREVEATRLLDQRLENVLEQHWRMTRLRRQATRLTRLRDIAASLLADASVSDLLARIVEGVVSLGYRMCWIGMARPDGSVEPVASFGDKEGYLQQTTEALREVQSGRDVEGFVTAVLARKDEERMVMWNATVARAAVGTVQCAIVFGVDITERLRLEREKEELLKNLAKTQKMEAMGAIAGGIAHEYNNILGAILGYTSLLQSRMGAGDPDLPAIRKIQESAKWEASSSPH